MVISACFSCRPRSADRTKSDDSLLSVQVLAWLALAFAALITAFVLAGVISFEYRNAAAHLMLDTVDACVALLVSYLLYGRLLRSRRLQDLLLLQGLMLLAGANLCTSAVLLSAIDDRAERLEVWLPLTLRVSAAIFIAGAALLGPSRQLPRISVVRVLGPLLVVSMVSAVGLGAMSSRLPPAL
jgi:hypothetical protein